MKIRPFEVKKRTPEDKAFVAGYGIACAEIVRLHDEPTVAADVLNASNFTLADFERSGLDPYDLKVIRKLFRTETVLRARESNPLRFA